MGQRLLDGCLGQLSSRPPSEGPSRRGDDDALQVVAALAPQTLGQRRVLRIDRHQPVWLAFHQIHDQLAAHHQRFLVGERQHLARLQRGQRRRQADGADHGVQDHVGVDLPSKLLHGFVTGQDVHTTQPGQVGLQLDRGILVRNGHHRGHELAYLAHQELVAGGRAETDHTEAVGVAPDHVQSLCSDGSGGTEDAQCAHGP